MHTHTAKAGVLGRLAALHLGPRRPVLVHTYHGHVLRGYFGPAKTAFFRRVERRLARWTDCLVAVSPGVAADLVSLGVASSDRFRSTPLGLELDRFLELDDSAAGAFRQELRIPPEETLAVFVGRLAPIKRVDLLIRAVARARAAGVPLHLAIVGDGELRADLSRLAETSGAADAITFCGFRFDLPTIAADTDIAVLSSDNEGTPVALIEAAAAARPALSTDVGGVRDVVTRETGVLVPAGDEEALAQARAALASDTARRATLGAAARERARNRWTVARLLERTEQLYDELLARRAAR